MRKTANPVLFGLIFILTVVFGGSEAFAKEVDIATDYIHNKDAYAAMLYDNSNGLPTSEANAMVETEEGFIWIGSYSGLIRYDSETFSRIDSKTGISSVVSLFVDSRGYLWVGTNDNGVFIVRSDVYEFANYNKRDGMGSSSVRGILEGTDGYVYIATTKGIVTVDEDMNMETLDDDLINEEYIRMMKIGADGVIYGITINGDVFTIENRKITGFYSGNNLGMEEVRTILPDPDKPGYVYLGNSETDIIYGKLGEEPDEYEHINVAPIRYINSIEKYDDTLWVCADNGIGVVCDGECKMLDDVPMISSVESMMTDYQGNLWFVSSKQGIMKIVPNRFLNMSDRYGIGNTVVNATCKYKNMLFVGCRDEGLKVIGAKGLLESLPVTDAKYASGEKIDCDDLIDYTKDYRIRSIIKDSMDRIWICSYEDAPVIRYDDGKVVAFREEDGLPTNRARTVCEKKDGSFMVACTGGLAWIIDDEVKYVYGESEGIENTEILTVAEGTDGTTVIGTDGGGMYVIKNGGVKHIGTDEGLKSEVVLRVKHDIGQDIFWIVTSNSLAYMDSDLNITSIDNFPYSNNFDLYENRMGEIWVLSSNGIYVIPEEDLIANGEINPVYYGFENGMTCIATANSYSYLSTSGNLYIAGSTGVCRVNIEIPFDNIQDVKMCVPYIEADGAFVYPDENGNYTIPSNTEKLCVNGYIFTYSLMDPTVTYYLKGFEAQKTEMKRSEMTINDYTNLRGGTYHFIMNLSDSYGRGNNSIDITIVKKKAFTELLIVRIGAIFVLIGLSAFAVWWIIRVTVIRRQYEQIRIAKDDAERANTAKSRFLANMSHEIRTPINTIMGMNEMILRENTDNVSDDYVEAVTGYADNIKRASETLLGLVNDLLDLSKVESGKMNLVEREYDTAEFVRSLTMMIRVRSEEKGLDFKTDIDENLPKTLYGDDGKLKEILLNLLTNALKYTKEGGFVLKIEQRNNEEGVCKIYYSVKDTGMGIKQEDIKRLFNAFERFDEVKNSGIQGTGLGLDISKKFVALMGGELCCDSVYGQGSTFYFAIDQKIVDETPMGVFTEEQVKKKKDVYVPEFFAPDAKVLAVDDNDMNLQVIRGILKGTKVNITTVTSGKECLEKLMNEEYHIVLLDHMMPEMDGIETLENIRKFDRSIPVIALTANVMSGGDNFYIQKGFNDYLSKPVDSKQIELTLKKYLPDELLQEVDVTQLEESDEALPDELIWLEDTEGISVADGKKNCGGTKEFIKSLNTFNDMIDESSDIIEGAYKSGDIEMYTIKVHALKSSARIIGAKALSSLAEKLENAGKNGDNDFIDAHT
nr:response regulator [Lachnospiraceae bacterium]